MKKLTIKIGDNLIDAGKKKYFNEEMFSVIAPKYDFITRLFSFSQDAAWKRELIAALPNQTAPFCVDLACGTGDLTFLLAEKYPQGKIVGLDLTEDMLILARQRNPYDALCFIKGDMGHIEMDSADIDIVTGGYALRNAPDLKQTIGEIHRILKPGGVAAFLDFSNREMALSKNYLITF